MNRLPEPPEKVWDWLPCLPLLLFLLLPGHHGWVDLYLLAPFPLGIFLTQKTLLALHFGTRRWTCGLWALLAVALCPAFWLGSCFLEMGQSGRLGLALAAVFFSVRFLEDGHPVDVLFLVVAAAAQCWLGLEIPAFEWAMMAGCVLSILRLTGWPPGWMAIARAAFWVAVAAVLGRLAEPDLSPPRWGWTGRLSPLWLPFWPQFGLFMPVCLFFLKKTDLTPPSKKWLAVATAASILNQVAHNQIDVANLAFGWLGLVFLAFPVFERGLLYGLVHLKKWWAWAVVGFFLLLQASIALWSLRHPF